MGYREQITVGGGEDVWKPAEGEAREGVYLGPQEVKGPTGNFASHCFTEVGTGTPFRISGADLDGKLAQVDLNTRIQLIYKGLKSTPRGRMKEFAVIPWEDDEPQDTLPGA